MAVIALGMVETRGLTGAIEAANNMLNSGGVKIIGKEVTIGNFITVFINGEFDAVKAAVEKGADSVRTVGELISYNVIPNPHPELNIILPNKNKMIC